MTATVVFSAAGRLNPEDAEQVVRNLATLRRIRNRQRDAKNVAALNWAIRKVEARFTLVSEEDRVDRRIVEAANQSAATAARRFRDRSVTSRPDHDDRSNV